MVSLSVNANNKTDFDCSASPLSQYRTAPHLFIFVSFSMPEQSLKLLAEQAGDAGGTLLLRGFVGDSLEHTLIKTKAIFGEEPDVDIMIDPEQFQKFNIQVVPAIVVAQSEPEGMMDNSTPNFDVVYGDTPLEEALAWILKSGSLDGQKAAKHFLKRSRGEI